MKEKRTHTLSCSRCRISKLKCDRKEPCTECVKRHLGHFCKKDERIKRRKRCRSEDGIGRQDEELVEKVVEKVETFVFDHLNQQNSGQISPDLENPYWTSFNREKEKFDLVKSIIEALPDSTLIRCLSEVFITRCQAGLGNVVHTPSHMAQIDRLCRLLEMSFIDEGARLESLMKTFSMDSLSILLLSLCLGLSFHPSPALTGWTASPLNVRVEEIRHNQPLLRNQWRTLATNCLYGGLMPFTGSIASLQASVMLLLDGQEDKLTLDGILANAINGARRMGLHRLGDAMLYPVKNGKQDQIYVPDFIRMEIGIRIWWALSVRDWAIAQLTGQYSIHPAQVSTRKPLHINDDDLSDESDMLDEKGCIKERPKTGFTRLSYTVCVIDIASIIREMVDVTSLRSMEHYRQKIENLISNLPPHFQMKNLISNSITVDSSPAIPVHRWMLNQQIWSVLLRLYRNDLSTLTGLGLCQELALDIIQSQSQLQSRCVVCGSLSTNEMQLFNAGLILMFGLLDKESNKEESNTSSSQLIRLMIRDRIREAIDLLRTSAHIKKNASLLPNAADKGDVNERKGILLRGIMLLDGLMEAEAEDDGLNLYRKVYGVIQSISKKRDHETSMSIATKSNTVEEQTQIMTVDQLLFDLNVLPIINEASFMDARTSCYNSQTSLFTTNDVPDMILDESRNFGEFLEMVSSALFHHSSPSDQDSSNISSLNTPGTTVIGQWI